MLIGEVLTPVPAVTASKNMANRLADHIRNYYLAHTAAGDTNWEENFFEDPDGIRFLREESFPELQAIDYIFRWWGSDDYDVLSGDLEVLFKVRKEDKMEIYRASIRFAPRDFVLGNLPNEEKKREFTRSEFCKAFEIWEKIYKEEVCK